MSVVRYDIGALKSPERMGNGWLKADGYLTRTGVFTYRNPDGTERKELRLADEVFKGDALKSFSQVPVTDDHPAEMLTAQNTRKYAVGAMSESVHRDGDFVRGTMLIFDADTIAKMDAGKVQLSCGYSCDLEDKSGEFNGEKYDAIQRNIRGNHVAVVSVGRAGEAVKVRMDAAMQIEDAELNAAARHGLSAKEFAVPDREGLPIEDAAHVRAAMARFGQYDFHSSSEKRTAYHKILSKAKALGIDSTGFEQRWSGKLDGASMTIQINGVDFEVSDTAGQAFTQERKALTEKADRAEGERDALKKQLDDANQARKDAEDPNKLRTAIKARVALETKASGYLKDVKLEDMTDRQIKCAVVEKIDNIKIEDSRGDEYVEARFDSCVERGEANAAARDRAREMTSAPAQHNDSNDLDEQKARERMLEDSRNRYKVTTAGTTKK